MKLKAPFTQGAFKESKSGNRTHVCTLGKPKTSHPHADTSPHASRQLKAASSVQVMVQTSPCTEHSMSSLVSRCSQVHMFGMCDVTPPHLPQPFSEFQCLRSPRDIAAFIRPSFQCLLAGSYFLPSSGAFGSFQSWLMSASQYFLPLPGERLVLVVLLLQSLKMTPLSFHYDATFCCCYLYVWTDTT